MNLCENCQSALATRRLLYVSDGTRNLCAACTMAVRAHGNPDYRVGDRSISPDEPDLTPEQELYYYMK